jgi:hypothetical protein
MRIKEARNSVRVIELIPKAKDSQEESDEEEED